MTAAPSTAARVDDDLTEPGASLRQPLKPPGDWAIARIARIRAARDRFDAAPPLTGPHPTDERKTSAFHRLQTIE